MQAPTWWTTDWSPSSSSGDPEVWPSSLPAAQDQAEAESGWVRHSDSEGPDDDAILAPLEAQFGCQVRSRQRVRDLAEVFTHNREVHAILDLMPAAFQEINTKFLEPAAGSGNFLVEILRRKLKLVVSLECPTQAEYEHRLLRAVMSIYAVDISPQNVTEARGRMAHTLLDHYQNDANTVQPTLGFLTAAALVLGHNIVVGNILRDADTIELCDWRPEHGHTFARVWSHALVPPTQRDLFWAERVQDAMPVHYSDLASKPLPEPRRKGKAR